MLRALHTWLQSLEAVDELFEDLGGGGYFPVHEAGGDFGFGFLHSLEDGVDFLVALAGEDKGYGSAVFDGGFAEDQVLGDEGGDGFADGGSAEAEAAADFSLGLAAVGGFDGAEDGE